MTSTRRYWLVQTSRFLLLGTPATVAFLEAAKDDKKPPETADQYKMADHWWAMIIDIEKCIGCGNCVRACAAENKVPEGFFRTWIERYTVETFDNPQVDSPDGGIHGFPIKDISTTAKTYFVPKMC